MKNSSLVVLVACLGLGAVTGCKNTPDEALVVFDVEVRNDVPTFATVAFSTVSPPNVPERTMPGSPPPSMFRFGYYMPGVSGTVVVRGRAKDSKACIVGEGTLTVTDVAVGKLTEASQKLVISKLPTASCPQDGGGDGAAPGDGGGGAAGGDGGPADAPVDSGAPYDAGEAGTADAPVGPDGGGGQTGTDGGGDAGPPKKVNGETCAAGAECASTFCVDGVCCESACAGQCEACAEATTRGTCVAVASGAPRGGRAACAGSGVCQGSCTGASRTACTYPGSATECRAASCTGGTATLAAACNGTGACPAAETVDCAPSTCAGAICAGGCSASQPCTTGNYCRAGMCVPKKANGMTCTAADECTSAQCADGVCCNSACTGPCQACHLTASLGTCSPVRSGTDDACSGTSICDANGACKRASGQTCSAAAECASGSCVDGRCCATASCGTCQACTGGGGTCVAVTNADDDTCGGATQSCDASGACKRRSGQACTAASQCLTGFCADGVCCNSACTGSCQYCADPGSLGTCAFVSGAPRTGHPACAGTGACMGTCGGTSAACVFPGASTSCRQPSCSNGVQTMAAGCNGMGSCPTAMTSQCNPYICGATACLTSCTSASQCAANSVCSGGACVACAAGQTVCNNQCVTLATSAAHCGSCGHSCRGGSCAGGRCQPVEIYTSTLGYEHIVASGRVYVMHPESTGVPQTTIGYVSIDAGPGTALTPYATIPMEGCSLLTADATSGDLFMSCAPLNASGVRTAEQWIRRIPATTGGAGHRMFQVHLNSLGPVKVHPQGGTIYFTELDVFALRRAAFTATAPTNIITYAAGETIYRSVGIDASSIFFLQSVGGTISLRQGALSNGSTITLLSPLSSAPDMISDGVNLYWGVYKSGVVRVPKGTLSTAPIQVFSDANLSVMGRVDSASIYYGSDVDAVTGATGCTNYRAARRPKAGGTEEALFEEVDKCIGEMKGDASVLTWRTRGRGCGTMTCSSPLLKLAN